MQLQLITPEKIFFTGEIAMVQVPGTLGDFGVLPGHAPFISTIRPGVVTIDLVGGERRKIFVVGGIAEVNPENCIVLAENADDCTLLSQDQIDEKLASHSLA